MAVGGCYACIKYLMFAFNFCFWLIGCAIIGCGIYVLVDPNVSKLVNEAENFNLFHTLAYILIAIGIIVMVVGFLGCCGAIRESPCMLGTFFAFLFIIFIVLLAAGIYAVVAKDHVKQLTGDALQRGIQNYYSEDRGHQAYVDRIQEMFKCCGATRGVLDYETLKIPDSCKVENYNTPCNDAFYDYIQDNILLIAGVAIGFGVVMLFGMILSMILCCAIRDV